MNLLCFFCDKMFVFGECVYIDFVCIVIGDVELVEDVLVWLGMVIRGDVNYVCIGVCINV